MRYPVYCIRNSTTVKEGNETLDEEIIMIRRKKQLVMVQDWRFRLGIST